LASSTIATHSASFFFASPTASAVWSMCAWVRKTWVASISSAVLIAAGLFRLQEGVDDDLGVASASVKHDWP